MRNFGDRHHRPAMMRAVRSGKTVINLDDMVDWGRMIKYSENVGTEDRGEVTVDVNVTRILSM